MLIQTNYFLARLTNRISPKIYFKAKQNGAFHGRSAVTAWGISREMDRTREWGISYEIGRIKEWGISRDGAFHGFTGDGQNRRMVSFHGKIGKSQDEAISREDRQITAWGHFRGRSADHRMAPFHGKIGRLQDGAISREDRQTWGHFRSHFTGCGVISQDVVILQDAASFHRMRRHFKGCSDFTGCGFISRCGFTGCTGNWPNHRMRLHFTMRLHRMHGKSAKPQDAA